MASTVVVGVPSTHIDEVDLNAAASVVVISPVGFVAVPTASSPVVPELGEADAELEGDKLADGDKEAEGDNEAEGEPDADEELDGEMDTELEGLSEAEGLILVDDDGLTELEGEMLTDDEGLRELEGDPLIEDEAEGLREAEGLTEVDGDTELEGEFEADLELEGETELEGEREVAVRGLVTLPNILTKHAPVTVNKVCVPIAPVLTPSKTKLLTEQIDQSGEVTGALSEFLCPAIVYIPVLLFL